MGPHCDSTVRSIIDEKADLLQRSLDHIQLGIEEAQVSHFMRNAIFSCRWKI